MAAALKQKVLEIKAAQIEKMEGQLADKEGERLGTMLLVLFAIAFCGIFIMITPFVQKKKYPGKEAVLFKYSAIASATFFAAVISMSVVLVVLRMFQLVLGSFTNPKLAIVNATFDVLADNAEDVAEMGPLVLDPLAAVAAGEANDVFTAIVEKAQSIAETGEKLSALASSFGWIETIAGLAQTLLVYVALGIFLLAFKPVLIRIVTMPGRVAGGELTGTAALGQIGRLIKAEFKVTGIFLVATVAAALLSSILLSAAVKPAVDAFLAYGIVSVLWVISDPEASLNVIYVSVFGSLFFLIAAVAVVVVGSAFLLGKVQKIARLRYHEGVPFGAHKHFWTRVLPGLVWAMAIPFLFVSGIELIVGLLLDDIDEDTGFASILLSGPLMLVIGFPLVFWGARGLKCLLAVKKYDETAAAAARTPELA